MSRAVVETVMRIARGDMRKVINLFQSIHLQYSGSGDQSSKIQLESGIGSDCTPEDVYRLTGTLPPAQVRRIFQSLMNDGLEDSLETVRELLASADANVASVLPELTELVLEEVVGPKRRELKLDALNLLADVEKKAARDIPEHLLRDYLVSQFFILRNVPKR